MFRYGFILAVLMFVLAGPAEASRCPQDMAAIDAALPTANISAEEKAKVQALRQKGEEEHAAGNHDESEAALGEAKDILGI